MHESEGFRVTDKNLIVGFIKGQGTTVRYAEVKIPLHDLVTSERLLEAMDNAVRRILIEKWSGLSIEQQPLF